MSMATDDAFAVQLLGSSEVIFLSIYKLSGFEVLDRHLDRELLPRWDGTAVLGEHELARWHLAFGRNNSHRCRITGPAKCLGAVGERELNSLAEVDEVVGRGQ